MKLNLLLAAALTCALSLGNLSAADKKKAEDAPRKVFPTFGSIERLFPSLDKLIPPGAQIEKLAEGFDWSEGPVWVKNGNYLLFSDVPRNVVFRWKEGMKTTEFIYPSGYTGSKPRGGEPGSNGLTLDAQGRLVLCQHGDRQVARYENGKFKPLAQYYNLRRFNSPNDLVYSKSGHLYFTDPPYGLEKNMDDPRKELLFQGVYRLAPDGKVELLTRELTRPNGIALSPDEKKLYVCVSDPQLPNIWEFDLDAKGLISGEGRILFNTAHLMPKGKGLPDGLKVDIYGNLFATGPGGVLVITPEGKHLGTINTGEATANCGWGEDGSVLYITADMYLCRVKTSTIGLGFPAPKKK